MHTEKTPDNSVYLGRIVGVHGVRGWVKIHSDCRPRDGIFAYRQFIARRHSRDEQSLKLTQGKTQGKGLIAKFDGIDDRDHAMNLHGLALYVARDALPPLRDGEYYWADLIGLNVVNTAGQALGTVKDLFETGANDVIVVAHPERGEILIPFVQPDYVQRIDIVGGTMCVDWSLDWAE